MTKSRIFVVVLLLLAAGAYFYYRHLSTTPEYALLQAAKAAKTHDVPAFEKYVDVGSITNHLVDDVAAQSEAMQGLLPRGLTIQLGPALQLLKPQLARTAQAEVRRYVQTGSLQPTGKEQPSGLLNVPVLGAAGLVFNSGSQFKGVKYTRQQGEQAVVGLEFTQPRYDTTMVLEVSLQDRGEHWQATRITNARELLQRVAQLEQQRLR